MRPRIYLSSWLRRAVVVVFGIVPWSATCTAGAVHNARPMIFEHLSTADGLPQGTIFVTLSDSQGFVWFGTEDGLVRYDGHEIHRYSYSPKAPSGLPGNFVVALTEDARGDLWLATKGAGLARWNRDADNFTVFKHDPSEPGSISSDSLWTLKFDARGRLWVGTLDAGLDVLDPDKGVAIHLRHEAGNAASLINDHVYSLMEDAQDGMWVGTDSGIDAWRLKDGRFARSGALSGAVLPGMQITAMVRQRDGSVWAATHESGLHQLSPSGLELAALKHKAGDAGTISNDQVYSLLDDGSGRLWVGTAGGLDSIQPASMEISHYVHDRSEPESLSDSNIMSLYKDPAGLMWIGTRASGVNRWNPHSWELGGANPAWLDGKMVICFADGDDGHVWIGTLGGGLYNFNPATGDAVNLDDILHQDNALGDRRIMSLHRDQAGDLWIGTWGKGLERLSVEGHLSVIAASRGDPNSLSAPGVATIYEAANGLLWIGTHGGGANIVDPKTGRVQQLPSGNERLGATSSENITAFLEDKGGRMWIGTENGGLDVANAEGQVLRAFRHDPADPQSLSSNIIYALEIDASGRVWAATDGGGLSGVIGSPLHPEKVQFETFSRADGLTSDTIYGVLRDEDGSLWLSGNSGLMRFDPRSHAVKTYHREHGLQGEEFDSGAYFRTRDGRLCFGGPGGFNIFAPRDLAAPSQPPRIVMTGFEVLGVPVHAGSPTWLLNRVDLDYRANVVSFDFAALDFTSPRRNQLAYRVSQLTDKWIDLNSSHRVNLTSLPAGDHVLEVRAANADSLWSTTPYRLIIHKAAPPWASVPAYVVYSALLLALILWAVRAQRAKLRGALAAQQQLESVVALRTKELREANQQLTVANESKSNFLARMGHELRTPMNGVVGMTELIARSPLSPTQHRQLQTIRTSSKTLLQILNDLLDLSKAQAGKTVLESLPLDINQLMEECVSMFAGAAEAKGIDIIVCPARRSRAKLFGDPLRLRQILMNLVGNAVKFTEKGEVAVSCDLETVSANRVKLTMTVADTGVGISKDAREKIFDPFTQADETTTRRFGGTGLGLSICRELTQLMGGALTLKSEPGKGSRFVVTVELPSRPQTAPGRPHGAERTLLIVSGRTALAKSVRRRASLSYLKTRPAGLPAALASDECDIVVLDAESHPEDVARFATDALRHRTVVVAKPATIEKLALESQVPKRLLLRSPIQQDAFAAAIQDAAEQIARGTEVLGSVQPPPDVTGTYQFPLITARVLIVEDDEVNSAVAEGYLTMLGCSSAWVQDGASAIARCQSERFDLILMDINMPGLDGYETARRIREQARAGIRTPIIALTANKASSHRDACLLAGMDDILSKPYSLAELTGVLRRWVDVTTLVTRDTMPGAPRNLTKVNVDNVAGIGGAGATMSHALFTRIASVFEANAEQSLAGIDAFLRSEDFKNAQLAAHKFKGAAGNVGAHEFATQLAELEEHCLKSDIRMALHLNKLLQAALPALIATLKQHCLRASA